MSKFRLKDRVKRIGQPGIRTVEEIRDGAETLYWIQLGSDFATRVWARERELELADLGLIAVVNQCPECAKSRGTSLSRGRVLQMIETGEAIRVIGGECGHVWTLADDDVKRIRKQIEAEIER